MIVCHRSCGDRAVVLILANAQHELFTFGCFSNRDEQVVILFCLSRPPDDQRQPACIEYGFDCLHGIIRRIFKRQGKHKQICARFLGFTRPLGGIFHGLSPDL